MDSFEPKMLRIDEMNAAAQIRFKLRVDLAAMPRMISKDSVITKIL